MDSKQDEVSLDINTENIPTLDALFLKRVEATPDTVAYRSFDKTQNEWQNFSWEETAQQVGRWQQTMRQEGLEEGDRVALNLRNSPAWVHFEQAALGLGLVVVPLYTDDRPDNLAYILEETGARLLLIQDIDRWRRVAEALTKDALPHLDRIIALEGENDNANPRLRSASQWLSEEGCVPMQREGDPKKLATIVFTSGTSGRPKGVMLNHINIISNAMGAYNCVQLSSDDRFLSFLPMAHMLERMAGYYLPMLAGSEVCFARSINLLATDLAEQKPTVLISVPRIYERVQGKIDEQLAKSSFLRRGLFKLAVKAGWTKFQYQQGQRGWSPYLLITPLTQRLVGNKLMAKFGGRMRFAISGGAPLTQNIARTFISSGLTLLQGYGLTETSPVIGVNHPEDNIPDSIGPPLEGVEVRLGEQDELQVRGRNVMLGYWNNHAATAQAIDHEGWLRTGDQASIGPRGHIHITGRLKDIIVLSNGEKVSPSDMEQAIVTDAVFEQVMVIGEGKAYLAALLVLNGEVWPAFAKSCGVDPLEQSSLHNKRVVSRVIKMLASQLHEFPGYAKIRRVHLTLEPWNIDNGLMTPTMKVKRPKVMQQLENEIELLFNGG
ncbi:MAG: long-chain fatty acid--CoA ligase [Pseudomonadota bacterium]